MDHQHRMRGHSRRANCDRVRLAEGPVASVDLCDCGTMQLNIGALTLRLTPGALSELLATLGSAVAEHAAQLARDALPGSSGLGLGRGSA